jgi:hypothetical protein
MRSVLIFGPLLVLAVALSACSTGSQLAPPAQSPTNVQSSSQMLPQSHGQANNSDVPNDGHHIFYPLVGQQNRAAHTSGTTNNLNYYGGLVMNDPKIYVVYWNWTSDPNREQPYLNNFLSGIGGSQSTPQWLNTVTQYYSNAGGPITDPPSQLGSTWNDTVDPVPNHPSDSQIQQEAVRAANHFGITGSSGVSGSNVAVMVATPTGHYTRGFGVRWCAYHSSVSTTTGNLSYTNFPYQTDAGTSCGENFVNSGSAGLLDGVSIVGGHEYAESITDPYPSTGWLDSSGSEIGDKCAWSSSSGDISLSTGTFAVQPLWSNAITGCAM